LYVSDLLILSNWQTFKRREKCSLSWETFNLCSRALFVNYWLMSPRCIQ